MSESLRSKYIMRSIGPDVNRVPRPRGRETVGLKEWIFGQTSQHSCDPRALWTDVVESGLRMKSVGESERFFENLTKP